MRTTCLVIPAAKVSTRAVEIDNIVAWAAENNLRLTESKCKEVREVEIDNIVAWGRRIT